MHSQRCLSTLCRQKAGLCVGQRHGLKKVQDQRCSQSTQLCYISLHCALTALGPALAEHCCMWVKQRDRSRASTDMATQHMHAFQAVLYLEFGLVLLYERLAPVLGIEVLHCLAGSFISSTCVQGRLAHIGGHDQWRQCDLIGHAASADHEQPETSLANAEQNSFAKQLEPAGGRSAPGRRNICDELRLIMLDLAASRASTLNPGLQSAAATFA